MLSHRTNQALFALHCKLLREPHIPTLSTLIASVLRALEPQDPAQLHTSVSSLTPGDWLSEVVYSSSRHCISWFAMKAGTTISLHDHPGMHVWMGVLTGRVQIEAYDNAHDGRFAFNQIFDPQNAPPIVTPTTANIHQIEARDDLLFVDVITPPYDPEHGRPCTYFARGSIREASSEISASDTHWNLLPRPEK